MAFGLIPGRMFACVYSDRWAERRAIVGDPDGLRRHACAKDRPENRAVLGGSGNNHARSLPEHEPGISPRPNAGAEECPHETWPMMHRNAAMDGDSKALQRSHATAASRAHSSYFKVAKYAIRSARLVSSFNPAYVMVVPGTTSFGAARYLFSVSADQTMLAALFAAE